MFFILHLQSFMIQNFEWKGSQASSLQQTQVAASRWSISFVSIFKSFGFWRSDKRRSIHCTIRNASVLNFLSLVSRPVMNSFTQFTHWNAVTFWWSKPFDVVRCCHFILRIVSSNYTKILQSKVNNLRRNNVASKRNLNHGKSIK